MQNYPYKTAQSSRMNLHTFNVEQIFYVNLVQVSLRTITCNEIFISKWQFHSGFSFLKKRKQICGKTWFEFTAQKKIDNFLPIEFDSSIVFELYLFARRRRAKDTLVALCKRVIRKRERSRWHPRKRTEENLAGSLGDRARNWPAICAKLDRGRFARSTKLDRMCIEARGNNGRTVTGRTLSRLHARGDRERRSRWIDTDP